jgi:pimeloyl-ACP methyl ester carboxylesterase
MPSDRRPVLSIHIAETFESDGQRLYYEIHGSGSEVIVYLHGLLLDANINRDLARRLAAAGYRVVLLDLPGHGGSDKPRHATLHRFDRYARHVVNLLDHLGVERATIGGVSLGADVSLQVAILAPDRVKALIVEMPVLENAAVTAAVIFAPLLALVSLGRPLFNLTRKWFARIPRKDRGIPDSLLNILSNDPKTMAAVLHGILVGPIAPDVVDRSAIRAPTLIIAHNYDLIHPETDARNLARQLPGARLIYARSILELRLKPERLMAQIVEFLKEAVPLKAAA